LSSSNARIKDIHSLLRMDIDNIQMTRMIKNVAQKDAKISSTNRIGSAISKSFYRP